MWILIPMLLVGQAADDILADEAKGGAKAAPAAATAPADPGLPPTALPTTTPAEGPQAAAPSDPKAGDAKAGTENATPAEAAADGEAKANEKGWLHDVLHTGAMGYMIDGGIFMWPILILGVLA